MKCPLCNRPTKDDSTSCLCHSCGIRLRQRIADLPLLQAEAEYCLQPQRGGKGTNSGEQTVGVNIVALDFFIGHQILNILHEWEKVIRHERTLTLPALLPRYDNEVLQSVRFHLAHLDWTLQQPWADEFAREIASLHSTGMTAARRQLDPVKRIPCPSPLEDGKICNALIPVKGDDLLEAISCRRCKTQWTPARLIAVSLSDPNAEVWLDAEAIGQWTGLSDRQVRRLVKQHRIGKKGQLINFTQLSTVRNLT